VAMAGYFKRAIQGNWRANADSFSDGQFVPNVSSDMDSPDQYYQPTMTPIINNITGPAYNLAAYDSTSDLEQRMIKVENWGTYLDTSDH